MRPLVLSTLLLTGSWAALSVQADEWRTIPGTTDTVNVSRLTRVRPGVYRVWQRYVLNEEALAYVRRNAGPSEYLNYSYSMALREIDCTSRKHGFVQITNYSTSGTPTHPPVTVPDKEVKLDVATPESSADALVEFSCKFAQGKARK